MKPYFVALLVLTSVSAFANNCELSTYFYRAGKYTQEYTGQIPKTIIQTQNLNECLKLAETELSHNESLVEHPGIDELKVNLHYAPKGRNLDAHSIEILFTVSKNEKPKDFYCKAKFYYAGRSTAKLDMSASKITDGESCLIKGSRRVLDASEYVSSPREAEIETIMISNTGRMIKVGMYALNLDKFREAIDNL